MSKRLNHCKEQSRILLQHFPSHLHPDGKQKACAWWGWGGGNVEEGKAALGRAEVVAVSDGIFISCQRFYPISFSYADFLPLIPWIASESCLSSRGKKVPACSHHSFFLHAVLLMHPSTQKSPRTEWEDIFLFFVISMGP